MSAGKMIRDLIRAHKHNVSWKLWGDLNPAQQASWDDVAQNFLKAMAEGPATKEPEQSSEGNPPVTGGAPRQEEG